MIKSIDGDVTNGRRFAHMMMNLEKEFNTDRHVSAAAGAAYSILEKAFNGETDATAKSNPDSFAHVYEWNMTGWPQARLFETRLEGRGRHRSVTWDWLPSKTFVPIDPDDYPVDFDTGRLNHTHVFTWKAPIMEYGTTVTVKRKNSKVLVIPNPERYSLSRGQGDSYTTDGDRTVLFRHRSYSFRPGEKADTIGNFTAWFMAWWSMRGEEVLELMFDEPRNNQFKLAFYEHTKGLRQYRYKSKTMSLSANSKSAMDGARDAINIARDVEKQYLRMARSREFEV